MAKLTRKDVLELTGLLSVAAGALVLMYILYGREQVASTLTSVLITAPVLFGTLYLWERCRQKKRRNK
jgi:nicotinamide riboside transporter PnuC